MLNAQWNEPARRASPGALSPQLKMAFALGLVMFIVLLPRRPDPLYAAPAAILAVAVVWCRLPPVYLMRRLLVAEFFIIGIAILSLVSPATRPVFLAVLLKSNLCVAAMLLLTWTTPFHEILRVLRRLRLPAVMLSTLALMSRYLPVLAEEARRMERARASRTFGSKRRVLWQSLGAIIGQLFVRSADRAERIYLAMCARGWK
jgi:cobalt/nickel transport system permease protein